MERRREQNPPLLNVGRICVLVTLKRHVLPASKALPSLMVPSSRRHLDRQVLHQTTRYFDDCGK